MSAKNFMYFMLGVLATMMIVGCTPPVTIDVNPGAKDTGTLTIAGTLLVTAEQLQPAIEKSATGLTAKQWADIINRKGGQVTSMDVKLAEFASGRIEYNGNIATSGISIATTLKNVKAGSYVLTTGYKGNNLSEWLFSDTQNVVIVAGQKTVADIPAGLNNFCQKQIAITGLDPAVAQYATPVLVITDSTGYQYSLTGVPHWFSDNPDTMEIVFTDGLAYDVNQPILLTFNNIEGKQVASMSLTFDPVAIAGWDLSVPFTAGDTGTLEMNIHGAPPIGAVVL